MSQQRAARTVAVFTHARRPRALVEACRFITGLAEHGLACLVLPEDVEQIRANLPGVDVTVIEADPQAEQPCELCVVFGGDGTMLRAAEWALQRAVPLLGVNLGHVGFLAELEPSDTPKLVHAVVQRAYTVEDRFALAVCVTDRAGEVVWSSFAVNEVSIEKLARERMLEVLIEIDGRPLSRWGCDGVLVATPTGSTAYAFSAGGPVVWPDVDAFLVVPLSAHALFARPIVLGPSSVVSITIVEDLPTRGVVWCDGRRTVEVEPSMGVRVVGGKRPFRIARLSEQPFTTRLVRKFGLRVEGWRGRPDAQMTSFEAPRDDSQGA